MSEMDVVARKRGDSIAIIIPKDKLHISLRKEVDLSDLFGKFKTKKTAQQLKDEGRTGWM